MHAIPVSTELYWTPVNGPYFNFFLLSKRRIGEPKLGIQFSEQTRLLARQSLFPNIMSNQLYIFAFRQQSVGLSSLLLAKHIGVDLHGCGYAVLLPHVTDILFLDPSTKALLTNAFGRWKNV